MGNSPFLYPNPPAYDTGPQAPKKPGPQVAAQPAPTSAFLYPDSPDYGTAAPSPSLSSPDGSEQTTRLAIQNPAFTAAQSPAHNFVGASGAPLSLTVGQAADGSNINVQLDVCASPLVPVDAGTPGDADGWGALGLVVDPPNALTAPQPSGTKITVTPRWSTLDNRTIEAGRVSSIVQVRAVVAKAAQ